MDWETFFQGLKDTRTGGGLFVVTLLLILFAPLGFCLLAESVAAGWTWWMAVAAGALNSLFRVDYLEVATFTIRCILFLSLASSAGLAVIIAWNRIQRFAVPVSVQSNASGAQAPARGLPQTAARLDSSQPPRVGTTRAPSWSRRPHAGPNPIRRAPRIRPATRGPRREDC